ncbi:exonuclease domain-containing protein [Zobellia galactanivorans]|uniref:exonuclease domain-containing protein n=1 Tax=Zobellia galactanivorans (strain DSM 12802 / CCUG 47099 / CIP 106680 / NCIMB 13871 / Dsij) TaxID=63186 RepID=UPI0026E324FA|nr:exonuclease domain-containing protein [Zobellia galactanivorans]MDO6807005.1 exonuclease domain-containing protein [Zobellia galactanivorans]
MYSIVDIETTGNGIKGNKITEISIFKFDGYEIVEEFTSLVNPQCEIPYFITRLTGIDGDMVRDAPTLDEIVDDILKITENTIFVAHSVNFDYNVIKNELKLLGRDFIRKKLCTVRLSRKLLPGYHSYSLGKLCSSLGIPLTDRHRARGDAHATTLLFKKLLRADGAEEVFKSHLNARSQETTLPSSLPREAFEKLPAAPGIYYFKDGKGKIIYVGKAINIKKRVLSHFYDKSTKEIQLCQATADIDFELSGSELVALLMESNAIKHHYPEFNIAQKRKIQPYGIFSYEDRNGIMHLAFNKLKMAPNSVLTLYGPTDCRLFIEEICKRFRLCPKYCHLQENVKSCSHYRIESCDGICREEEATDHYNEKVHRALHHIRAQKEDFVIREKGRNANEQAFVYVKNSTYMGYGFVDRQEHISAEHELETFLVQQNNTLETESIIKSYLSKNPDKIVILNSEHHND